jgi:hypothetical protein
MMTIQQRVTPEQFAYWLQGFAELSGAAPTQAQWDMIREHLNLVFNKVTPPTLKPQFEKAGPVEDKDRIDVVKRYADGIEKAKEKGAWPDFWEVKPTLVPKYGDLIC